QLVKLFAPRIDPRQRLASASASKLGRLRPDHLAHHLPRHPKLAADRLIAGASLAILNLDLREWPIGAKCYQPGEAFYPPPAFFPAARVVHPRPAFGPRALRPPRRPPRPRCVLSVRRLC